MPKPSAVRVVARRSRREQCGQGADRFLANLGRWVFVRAGREGASGGRTADPRESPYRLPSYQRVFVGERPLEEFFVAGDGFRPL